MKWYYQSGMEDDTLLVLKNFDSKADVAKCTLPPDSEYPFTYATPFRRDCY